MGSKAMNIKQLVFAVFFVFASMPLHANEAQVKLAFIENGPLGSDMYLQLNNTGTADVVFRNMKRDSNQCFLVLAANPAGNLIRRKSWQKLEPVKIPPKPGYLNRKGRIGSYGRTFHLPRNSSDEMYTLLLSLVKIPCFKLHYVMFVLRDDKRLYTTNVLCFERTGERHMRQIDITKSGVPEAISKTFENEIKLLYQEEGLKPGTDN